MRAFGVALLLSCSMVVACGGDVFEADGGGTGGVDGGTGGSGTGGLSTGGAASGGSSTGGSASGGTAGTCANGQLTFQLTNQKTKSSCASHCGQIQPVVRDSEGKEYRVSSFCTTSCDACQPLACAASACAPGIYFADQDFAFSGTTYESSTCGASITCDASSCLPAGRYTAEFCATAAGPDSTDVYCDPSGEPYCKTVDFDWTDGQTGNIAVDMTP
jgi:hypothetical protein